MVKRSSLLAYLLMLVCALILMTDLLKNTALAEPTECQNCYQTGGGGYGCVNGGGWSECSVVPNRDCTVSGAC